jgi:hypothetical protein
MVLSDQCELVSESAGVFGLSLRREPPLGKSGGAVLL